MKTIANTGTPNTLCDKCGKPFTYVGDIPPEGFPVGSAPWCECGIPCPITIPINQWQYCPHCGKELK